MKNVYQVFRDVVSDSACETSSFYRNFIYNISKSH